MDSLKNLFVILFFFAVVGLGLYGLINGFDLSTLLGRGQATTQRETLRDYSYGLTVTTPEGEEIAQVRISGELTPKVRNGFYLKDLQQGVILDVRNDGSVNYFFEHRN